MDKRISDARHADAIEIACEQTVSSTYTADLARALVTVLRSGRLSPDLYHMANRGACGWHEFTRRIYHYMRLRVRVIPVDRGGISGSFRRPLFSALASAHGRKLRLSLPPWPDALRRYLTAKHGPARVRPARP